MKSKWVFTWFEMHGIAARQNVKRCSEKVENLIWFIRSIPLNDILYHGILLQYERDIFDYFKQYLS